MRNKNHPFSFFRVTILAAMILAAAVELTGCNQQRYQPAKWRRSARPNATTLPSDSFRGTTLPFRRTTLPYRGTTLPAYGSGTTLPLRMDRLRQLPADRSGTTLPD